MSDRICVKNRFALSCSRPPRKPLILNGEMSEWFKEHAWKACVGETLPRVRIPLSPPTSLRSVVGARRLQASTGLLPLAGLGTNPSLCCKGEVPPKRLCREGGRIPLSPPTSLRSVVGASRLQASTGLLPLAGLGANPSLCCKGEVPPKRLCREGGRIPLSPPTSLRSVVGARRLQASTG